MKLLQTKHILSTVLLSCTLLLTATTSAQEVSLEKSLAATVQAQGQKVLHDLSAELSHSIKAELNRFSMKFSTEETQELAAVVEPKKSNLSKPQTTKY
ncbi:MAG: hypothetical protein V7736_16960 [Colwellia polaris]|jgi:hypothetical protein|uniref:hypothetical protein n=1 Tax=Colwellia polaris TaxID=326537 RepID=UPI000A16DDD0|nr:hypothetical protein [Colwellia polaris]|tara:strand:- start:202 stop:495 length:294 start_codon:yes stop_codon:yes gene_type:complete